MLTTLTQLATFTYYAVYTIYLWRHWRCITKDSTEEHNKQPVIPGTGDPEEIEAVRKILGRCSGESRLPYGKRMKKESTCRTMSALRKEMTGECRTAGAVSDSGIRMLELFKTASRPENASLFQQTNRYVKEIAGLVRGKAPAVVVNTLDPQYAKFVIRMAAEYLHRDMYLWNRANKACSPRDILLRFPGTPTGLITGDADEGEEFDTFADMLAWYRKSDCSNIILTAEDIFFELMVSDDVKSELREFSYCLSDRKTLIIINNNQTLPEDMQRVMPEVSCPLPDSGTLACWCCEMESRFGIPGRIEDIPPDITAALQGMTLSEAGCAVSLILAEKGKLAAEDAPALAKKRQETVDCGDSLTFCDTNIPIEDVGGMDLLKNWIRGRDRIHSPEAKAFGIRPPKGILLVGPPGTGKSLAARTIAGMWKRPLIELEIGSLFDKYFGESEKHTRNALEAVDSFAPCVLLIDELEKGLSGACKNVDMYEVSARVVSMIMKWMQNRESDVFIVATANSVEELPPEVLRKGRFDEIFFVDLPTQKERMEILGIHLRKRGHEITSKEELEKVAEAADGYTGTEIEHAIETALIGAFFEKRDLTSADIIAALKAAPPLSVRHSEKIQEARISGRKSGVPVSSEEYRNSRENETLVEYW